MLAILYSTRVDSRVDTATVPLREIGYSCPAFNLCYWARGLVYQESVVTQIKELMNIFCAL